MMNPELTKSRISFYFNVVSSNKSCANYIKHITSSYSNQVLWQNNIVCKYALDTSLA